jgi:predicted metalloprotease with PDZ domain
MNGLRICSVAVTLLPALFLGTAAGAQQKRVEYEISFPNAAEHEARVVATFYGIPRGSVLHARMSRSSPGRYAGTTFAKSVYDVSAADGHGKMLVVKRADDHEWDVSGHDGTVRIGYTVWGDRIDGTNLSVDHWHAHLNMPATFMWAPETENAPIRLSVRAPQGWSVATQLVPTSDSTTFTAPNMQWFMDSPTEVGPVTWRTWTATYGGKISTFRLAAHTLSTAAQVDTFTAMARAVVAEEIAMWGEPAHYDFGTYTFIGDYVPWAGGDGMEHRNSTILTSSRGLDTHANRMGNLSSLAHEFFHSWNMERIRSKEIEPFNFDHVDMSDGLWFGEGFTNYYGPLLIRRAGFYADSDFVRRLGNEMVGTINSPARRHGSPVDMSREAVFFDGASYPEGTNSPNTFLSYYTWGSMVAAGLDFTLRERFNLTLDDYMRAMWRDFGSHQSKALAPERPYTVADLRAELAKVTRDPAFATDFFRRYVEGREVPDFATLVRPAGLVLMKDSVVKPLLGASLDNDAKGVFVNWTSEPGSAYAAGLSSGDIIVSVNGEPATSIDVLNAMIAKHRVGDVLQLDVLQKGKIEAPVTMTLKGIPTLHLVTFESAGIPVTDAVRAFRKSWLGSKVTP